jgi:hypothetical protein
MSFAEIEEKLPSLTPEERQALAHRLLELELKDDEEYGRELDRRMAEMDAGKKVTEEEFLRIHRELAAKGQ